MADAKSTPGLGELARDLPTDRLKDELKNVALAFAERGANSLVDQAQGLTERLTEYANDKGGPGLMAAIRGAQEGAQGGSPAKGALKGVFSGVGDKVKEALGGGSSGGGGGDVKVTNIVEDIDVGVPVRVAYNQWTQYQDWTSFMKKVEHAEQEEDGKVNLKAQVFWSHRSWESTITEQVPDDRIVWRSSGQKGHVDGTVTFHELGPRLTRILVVLEYHPQGFFEKTGNLWRAQGRRARLELKHFRRHVMTQTILDPDDVEGWRGEIRDSEVVKSHEDALAEEEEDQDESGEGRDDQEPPGSEDEPQDEDDEESPEEEPAAEDEEQPEDEDEEQPEDEEEEAPEDEEEEAPEEPAEEAPRNRRTRRPATSGRSR
ncbi:MAG: SRPBCC family protein [Streptosporangiales bacterium]